MAQSVMSNTIYNNNELDIDIYARGEDGRGIVSTTIEYQAGTSAEIVPSGDWTTQFPSVSNGEYLWTRVTFKYNDNTTMYSYNITYFPYDGATYLPNVDNNGNISWTNDRDFPNPETINIRGPQGEMGSVKFVQVNSLPTENIQNDAFYFLPAENASSGRWYSKWVYINDHWEDFEQDLNNYYTKGKIDSMFEDISNTLNVSSAQEDVTYYLTGIRTAGADEDAQLVNTYSGEKNSGVSYRKDADEEKGRAYVDGSEITTGLFFDIS